MDDAQSIMATGMQCIGVLTGGGDCPGLNAVIRAVAKSAMGNYHLDVVGIEDGFLGLIENRMRPLHWNDVSSILTRGGTILGTSNKSDPQRYAVRNLAGELEYRDVTQTVLDNIRQAGLDALICIGGDGTMTAAANLVKHGVNCIGVPKTIDNDIVGCDITFGFDTAVTTAAEALDKIHSTAASHHRAMLVEVMGRNAGWLALHAGVATGADIILIPEIPYSVDKICDAVVARRRKGRKFSIICVSEGAKEIGGKQTIQRRVEGSPEPIRLGGVSLKLAQQIEDVTGIETRATVLGHVQRGGTPTPFDRVLATRYGHHAVELLMNGETGKIVVMQDGLITQEEIMSVAGKQRLVSLDHPLMLAARAVGTMGLTPWDLHAGQDSKPSDVVATV